MGRCPTLLDVFFVVDCNNSSASFKVIWSKKRFLCCCYIYIGLLYIFIYIYLVWGSFAVIIYYILFRIYIYIYILLASELVQSVVVIRRRGEEAYSTPCTWAQMTYYSRKTRGEIFFPLRRVEPSELPFAAVRRLLFWCIYLYIIVNPHEVNRPQSTEHAKYIRQSGRTKLLFVSFFFFPRFLSTYNIYILYLKSRFYSTRIPRRRSLITHKNAYRASKLHVLDGAPTGIRNELAITCEYNIYTLLQRGIYIYAWVHTYCVYTTHCMYIG